MKKLKSPKSGLFLLLKLGGGAGRKVQVFWAFATKPQAALWSALQFGRLTRLGEKQVLFVFLCPVFNWKSEGEVSNQLLNSPRCVLSCALGRDRHSPYHSACPVILFTSPRDV